jgi:Ubiquitin-like domain
VQMVHFVINRILFLCRLEAFWVAHPCYKRLAAEFGEPEASEVAKEAGHGRLKNSLVSLLIECPKLHEVLEKRFPRTMKVQRLRGMLPKLLPAAPSAFKLRYVSSQKPDVSFDFDNDLRDLAYYSIQDKDTILVDW